MRSSRKRDAMAARIRTAFAAPGHDQLLERVRMVDQQDAIGPEPRLDDP
jgi:hypothetical protein